jgi:uncharacterized protein YggE
VVLTLSGAAEDATTLTVVGEGSALASADVVYVSISATTVGENLTQASANSSETLNRTIDALIDAGVNSDDIQVAVEVSPISRPIAESVTIQLA